MTNLNPVIQNKNDLSALLLRHYSHLPDFDVSIPTVMHNVYITLHTQKIVETLLDMDNPLYEYLSMGCYVYTEHLSAEGEPLEPVTIDYMLEEYEKGTIDLSHRREDGKTIIVATQKRSKRKTKVKE